MAFIRLSDDYIDNPKFNSLSDGAFRLWHESLAHCRRHLTDGLFNFATMRGFPRYTRGREKQLSSPYIEGAKPLWELVPKFGYKLHDYLALNLSKEAETANREAAKARMRSLRTGRQPDDVRPNVRANISRTNAVVLGMGMGLSSDRKNVTPPISAHALDSPPFAEDSDDPSLLEPTDVERFIHEDYPRIYAKCRHGAIFRVNVERDFSVCDRLVQTYGRERLCKMLELWLLWPLKKDNLNDPGTPRQLAHMAPTLDGELRKNGQ